MSSHLDYKMYLFDDIYVNEKTKKDIFNYMSTIRKKEGRIITIISQCLM